MRTLNINKREIFYALYIDKTPIKDEYGNETGDFKIIYSKPIKLKLNVSAAKGENSTREFGDTIKYDKVLLTDDLNTPISEDSVLWVDNLDISSPHDYVVKKIAKSINSVLIAISRVNISE